MLGRQEKMVLAILLTVTGITVAGYTVLEAVGKESFAKPYTNDVPTGSLVRLEGAVQQVSLTETGGHLIIVVNQTKIFVPSNAVPEAGVSKGDLLMILGTVQNYRGDREIVVGEPGDIRAWTAP